MKKRAVVFEHLSDKMLCIRYHLYCASPRGEVFWVYVLVFS
jgi:hypothetical protein